MSDMIDLKGLDKASVLAALYNAAKAQGMGFYHYDPTPMSAKEAKELLKRQQEFDYLKGRVMKVDLSGDELDPYRYDRDNGQGAAARAIDSLRTTRDVNSVEIRAKHAAATQASADDVLSRLSTDKSEMKGDEFHLGLDDVAGELKPKINEAMRNLKSPFDE